MSEIALVASNGVAVQPTLKKLVDEIKKFWDRADASEHRAKLAEFEISSARSQAREAQIETGKRLATLKAIYKTEFAGMTWPQVVRQQFDRSQQRADELIRIATGRTTVEETRERAKRSMRKARQKKPMKQESGVIEMPTEEEAEKEYQQTIYAQACLFLDRMTGETRRKYFAHIRRKYHDEI